MKAHYRTENGRITFELSGETAKDLFSSIAAIQEVFEADIFCGCCNESALRFVVRKVDDFDFYELRCLTPKCHAKLAFGQAKKGGGLFPKRKDKDGNWLPNGGWEKYQKGGKQTTRTEDANEQYGGGFSDEDVP